MKRRQALLAVAVLLPAAWAAILGPVPAAGPAALARVPPPILGRFWEPKPGERRQAVERILEVELARLQSAFELNWKRLCVNAGLNFAPARRDARALPADL